MFAERTSASIPSSTSRCQDVQRQKGHCNKLLFELHNTQFLCSCRPFTRFNGGTLQIDQNDILVLLCFTRRDETTQLLCVVTLNGLKAISTKNPSFCSVTNLFSLWEENSSLLILLFCFLPQRISSGIPLPPGLKPPTRPQSQHSPAAPPQGKNHSDLFSFHLLLQSSSPL